MTENHGVKRVAPLVGEGVARGMMVAVVFLAGRVECKREKNKKRRNAKKGNGFLHVSSLFKTKVCNKSSPSSAGDTISPGVARFRGCVS